MNWILISGSYPPDHGGVAHYTETLARRLGQGQDRVWVFTGRGGKVDGTDHVTVVRLSSQFGPRALRRMSREIEQIPEPRRIFVQYIPQALGPHVSLRRNRFLGIPLSLCLWLRRRPEQIWVMFHELRADTVPGASLPVRLLGSITRWMVRLTMGRCERAFLSTPRWEKEIREDVEDPCPLEWMPIPSNLPVDADPAMAAAVRRQVLGDDAGVLLGHFGTFKSAMTRMFEDLLPDLLSKPERKMLLIGQNSEAYRDQLVERQPRLAGRVLATGDIPLEDAAISIAACDLMLQPFPDGASSRRSSLMAPLALGRPTVTNVGHWSEPVWTRSGCVEIADFASPPAALERIESLLARPERRVRQGKRAREVYNETFSWQRTIRLLRRGAAGEAEAAGQRRTATKQSSGYALSGD